jgi:uncharacterized membrane protein YgcG
MGLQFSVPRLLFQLFSATLVESIAMPGNPLELGSILGSGDPLPLPASARERHVYVCGGTGVGKSKFLEHCIRQDILNWRDGKCGLLLLDPHGLVYQNTLAWLARHDLKRPIVPIDLRKDDWIVSYNFLRKRTTTDSAVIVAEGVRGLAHVWGARGTDQTPLFAHWASVILLTLYQNGYTIADVMHLLSRPDIRRAMSARVTDPTAKQAWAFAERHPKEFEQQITSTVNRFHRLLGPKVMKATFGQPDISLDLHAALEEGQIILVNLSTEGGQIDEEDADTFATLLLTDLWTAAKSRGKKEREKMRPFYVYVDECQNFITPTIAKNLDQARGFGLHLTLAHQFPSQLLNAGEHGKAMYDSILANAGTKIVFRVEHPDDIEPLAKWLFMSTFDTDKIKLSLESTKVMGYREEIKESRTKGKSKSSGRSSGRGGGSFQGVSAGDGSSGTESFGADDPSNPLSTAEGWNDYVAYSSGDSANWQESESESETESESVTRSPVQVAVIGKEVSSVQYRPIDEQLFAAMQKLFDQEDRHFAVRFHGGPRAPLFVMTPTVKEATTRKEVIEKFRLRMLQKLPFVLPMTEAMQREAGREQKLIAEIVDVPFDEPVTAKRRIKGP